MSILLTGATGTIGRAVALQLARDGQEVLCALRRDQPLPHPRLRPLRCDMAEPGSLTTALAGRTVSAVISCMATRSGAPADAWRVEHDAQLNLLNEARAAGAEHFVLLSAICVQRPQLVFQQAKLAFEQALRESGIAWSIVRPTAFFKSLSGQVARVRKGKPFLVFGDGRQTACKPISDRDLADYIVGCLTEDSRRHKVLPIGGPGPAITPMDQAERLFDMLGQPMNVKHVPFALMDAIAGTLGLMGTVSRKMRDKAEFARTGRYYARESMLLWNPVTAQYDADATPEFGTDTLWDHYAALLRGEIEVDLGAHAVF